MEKRYPIPRPTVLDLFCGAGGMSLGFEQAGFDIILGIDRDGHHIATHQRNFPYGKTHCGSIVDLDGKKIEELVDGKEIDVVIGGPPCQGFSNMGLRDLKDPRNSLIDHFVRIVLEIRPKVFVMENVPGLLSGKTRSILDALIKTAEKSGYNVTQPVQLLDASDFGVPQKRRRLFVIGVRSDISSEIPYPEIIVSGQPKRPTVLDAIGDLPCIENYDCLFDENSVPYDKSPKSEYAKVARGVQVDHSDLSRPRLWNSQTATGCLRTQHAKKSVELYDATPPGETVPGHKLPRLHPDGIAPTLRAGSDSAHGSYTAPRPIHPLLPRCITSREAARLHGFPDWFSMYPLKWHAYRQIGNAVCPPVAKAIGREIISVLNLKHTKRKPAKVILEDTFILPDDRPLTLKRIPVLEVFPPVLEHLFFRAYNAEKSCITRPYFTFKDVEQAISATNSDLHWAREDTFLPEIARSRRTKELLSVIISHGYSILPCLDGKHVGKFVPVGTPGTIEDKDSIQIRIDEIHNALSLPVGSLSLKRNVKQISKVLNHPVLRREIWGPKSQVSISSSNQRNLNGESKGGRASLFDIKIKKTPRSRMKESVLLMCKTATLPAKTRIFSLAKQHETEDLLLFISATSRHFVAIHFGQCLTKPKEISRSAFELVANKK